MSELTTVHQGEGWRVLSDGTWRDGEVYRDTAPKHIVRALATALAAKDAEIAERDKVIRIIEDQRGDFRAEIDRLTAELEGARAALASAPREAMEQGAYYLEAFNYQGGNDVHAAQIRAWLARDEEGK